MGSLEDHAETLAKVEAWVRQAAAIVSESRGIDDETALAAARWGSLWFEDFRDLLIENEPSSKGEVKQLLNRAFSSSLEKCERVPRYPAGAPAIRAVIVAQDVLCLAFGDEAEYARELLKTDGKP